MDTIAKIAFGETRSLQGSDNNSYIDLAKKVFRPPEHPITFAAISLGGGEIFSVAQMLNFH